MAKLGRGILDTNIVILVDQLDDAFMPSEPLITAVTLAELSVGPLIATDADEAAVRQTTLQLAESTYNPLPFDAEAARAFGRVSAALRGSGRKITARTFDAMIAATALAHDLPLHTCNPRDFEGIPGLQLRPVPPPSS